MKKDKRFAFISKALTESSILSERKLYDLSFTIDDLINSKEEDENILSMIFDSLLHLTFIDVNKLIEVFNKLLIYCDGFNKPLAYHYKQIMEDNLKYDEDLLEENKRGESNE